MKPAGTTACRQQVSSSFKTKPFRHLFVLRLKQPSKHSLACLVFRFYEKDVKAKAWQT